jgi:hypothetical protein
MTRNSILMAIAASAACLLANQAAWTAPPDFSEIEAVITKQHEEAVQRLQQWIRLPSIASPARASLARSC